MFYMERKCFMTSNYNPFSPTYEGENDAPKHAVHPCAPCNLV